MILSIIFFFTNNLVFAQNIRSFTIHSQEDETIESGLELQSNKYLFITRHGTFSDTLEMSWWGIYGYNSRLYVSDSNLNIEDSIDLLIPGYYTIAYKIQIIRDTVIILGRAIKTDLSEEHIFFSSFTKDLSNIQTDIIGIQGNYELFFDADTNSKGQIVITAISNNFPSSHHNLFIVTNNKKELISYIADTASTGYVRIHYNTSSNTYHLINAQSVSFYDTNFCKIEEKDFPFKNRFFNQYYLMPVDDFSYTLQGIGFFKRKNRDSGLDISYYLVDTGFSVIDSNYIYLPDSLDNAGGMDFKTTDSIFMGGTYNTNWGGSFPPQFQHENHKLVLQCSNLYTDDIYWTTKFAGNGNYLMKNVFVTSANQCIVMATYYNWQSNPVQERDIVLFKIDDNGMVTTTNLKNNHKFNFNVYPNPGKNRINIKNNTSSNFTYYFRLINIKGNIVAEQKLIGSSTIVNINFLPKGTYTYTISDNYNIFESGVWIKE